MYYGALSSANGETGELEIYSQFNGETLLRVVLPVDDDFCRQVSKITAGIRAAEKNGFKAAGKLASEVIENAFVKS